MKASILVSTAAVAATSLAGDRQLAAGPSGGQGGELRPCLAAQTVQSRFVAVATVARQDVDIFNRDVKLVAAGVVEFETIMRMAECRHGLEPDEARVLRDDYFARFGGVQDYLRGVVDYDQVAPVFQWSKNFSASELGSLIGGVGRVRSLSPQRITPHGRVIRMRVVGDQGSKLISDTQLRRILELRSTLFTISANNGTFAINGRGFGHGIGLSQWGAFSLADQGVTYDRILSHYYQNASLTEMSPEVPR